MHNQRHLFTLPHDLHYLNCAYMSPLLKSVEEAGQQGLLAKRNPASIAPADFFSDTKEVKALFAELVRGRAEQIVIIPSVAYGMANALNNCPGKINGHALIVADEFPSGYYALERWAKEKNNYLNVIHAPANAANRGQLWNEKIISSISTDTSVLVISHTHWVDGTLFNLKEIGRRCKETDTYLIVDGTQSVGALPFSVEDFNIDALICAAYKWLMGPYAIGLAYYSNRFNNGKPIEESWANRSNAENFRTLTQYTTDYFTGAARYNVGESSNFILLPMLKSALEQINDWQPQAIQAYCQTLTRPLVSYLQENNCWLEQEAYRSNHLFGFKLPEAANEEKLLRELEARQVKISVRGNSIRVSPHVYNTEADIAALINTINFAMH